jgi:hypothetical protein
MVCTVEREKMRRESIFACANQKIWCADAAGHRESLVADSLVLIDSMPRKAFATPLVQKNFDASFLCVMAATARKTFA